MKNLLSSRLLLVTIILVVGVMLVGQNMGIAGPQASPEASEQVVAASPAPQLDWALAAIVLGGALITLLRPRRRKVVKVPAE
ncbi:MAG: hypothetical protein QGG25_09735 [Phycisphaerae bacterium]|jgi:hypothetical protein|nr:hypothetical protein [Phycisphaerae bacterium]